MNVIKFFSIDFHLRLSLSVVSRCLCLPFLMRAPCVSSLQPGARFKVANSLVLFSTRKDQTIIVRYSRGTKRAYAASFMRGNVCLVEDEMCELQKIDLEGQFLLISCFLKIVFQN